MSYEIRVETDYVLVHLEPGTRGGADLLVAMVKELYELDAFRREKKAVIWDLQGALPDLRFDDMRRVKDYVEAHHDPSWTHRYTAIVADQELVYGFARMYEMLAEDGDLEIRTFRNRESAVAWIQTVLSSPVASGADCHATGRDS